MKAVVINEFGGTDVLKISEIPIPEPQEGEVLVKIKAIGINPVDVKIRQGFLQSRAIHQLPIILGWDFSGVVEKNGFGARRFKQGDEVFSYCRRPIIKNGTYAEYIAVPECYITNKPKNISFEEAASIPLVSLTAYQSIFSSAKLKEGETILILGASGGVGTSAIQLAKSVNAKVIGLASKKNHDYIKSIGADEVIDYQEGDFRETLKLMYPNGVDLVFDCVGGATFEKGLDCVKKGGRIATILMPNQELLKGRELEFYYVFVEANVSQLNHIKELIEAGKLKPFVSEVYSLDDIVEVHEKIEKLHTRGKIVVRP